MSGGSRGSKSNVLIICRTGFNIERKKRVMKRVIFSMLSVILGIGIATVINYFFDYDVIYLVVLYIPIGAFLLGQLLGFLYYNGLMNNNVKIGKKDITIACIIALIAFVGISFGKFQLEVNLNNNQEYLKYGDTSYTDYLKEWFNNSEFTIIEKDMYTRKGFFTAINKTAYKIIFILYNFFGLLLGITWGSMPRKTDIDIEYCEQCNTYKDIVFDFEVPIEVSEEFISKLDRILSENEMTLTMDLNNLIDGYLLYDESITDFHPRIEVVVVYCSDCNLYELNLRRYIYTPNKLIRKLESLSNNNEVRLDKKYNYNKRISNDAVKTLIKAKANN